MKRDLNDRLFKFAVSILNLIKNLPTSPEYKVIKYQLAKSSTSSGANYEESQAGSSRADFANKVRIALREMRESNYWLRLLYEIYLGHEKEKMQNLIVESTELKNILGSILVKTK